MQNGSIAWVKSTLAPGDLQLTADTQMLKKGEVFFEVADTLTLICDALTIISPGNSFFVHAKSGKVIIAPIYKHVKLKIAGDILEIGQGEKITYRKKDGAFSKDILKPKERDAIVAGTAYEFRFSDKDVKEIVNQIENKYEIKIYVSDELKDKKLTIDLTDRSLKESINMIAASLGASYDIGSLVVKIGYQY